MPWLGVVPKAVLSFKFGLPNRSVDATWFLLVRTLLSGLLDFWGEGVLSNRAADANWFFLARLLVAELFREPWLPVEPFLESSDVLDLSVDGGEDAIKFRSKDRGESCAESTELPSSIFNANL